VLVLPSPWTATHSTPDPAPPMAVSSAAMGAGTAISVSLAEPAVLTTLPATVTGAADVDVVAVDDEPELDDDEHAATTHRASATAATATVRGRLDWADRLRLMPQRYRPGAPVFTRCAALPHRRDLLPCRVNPGR